VPALNIISEYFQIASPNPPLVSPLTFGLALSKPRPPAHWGSSPCQCNGPSTLAPAYYIFVGIILAEHPSLTGQPCQTQWWILAWVAPSNHAGTASWKYGFQSQNDFLSRCTALCAFGTLYFRKLLARYFTSREEVQGMIQGLRKWIKRCSQEGQKGRLNALCLSWPNAAIAF